MTQGKVVLSAGCPLASAQRSTHPGWAGPRRGRSTQRGTWPAGPPAQPSPGSEGGQTGGRGRGPPALTRPLTEAAVGPQEPRGAVAGSGDGVAGAPVETSAQLLTARPEAPRRAPCREQAAARAWVPQHRPRHHPPPPPWHRPEDGRAGSTHAAGSWGRGSRQRTRRRPRQGGKPGSRRHTGISARSSPQRCRAGRLGRRRRGQPQPRPGTGIPLDAPRTLLAEAELRGTCGLSFRPRREGLSHPRAQGPPSSGTYPARSRARWSPAGSDIPR